MSLVRELIAALSAESLAALSSGGGAVVRNGSGVPSSGTGSDGDFYIDTVAKNLYGPKASGAWGSATSIVGPTGATGSQGATGATGPQGATGATGPTGPTGATGSTGADGKTVRSGSGAPSGGLGVDGDFYINTAANTLYGPKTAGAWGSSTSLVGPTGATGATGSTGAAGTNGNTILTTSGLPGSPSGVNGDYAFDNATGTIYGPKAGGVWTGPGLVLRSAIRRYPKTVCWAPANGSITNVAGRVHLLLLEIDTACKIDQVTFQIGGGGGSGNFIVGVYGPVTPGSPDETALGATLVAQSASTAFVGSAGTVLGAALSMATQSPGMYYVALHMSLSTNIVQGHANSSSVGGAAQYFDQTFGSLPGIVPALGSANNRSNIPTLQPRCVA